jgi:NitT/TauT family transport system substrate-binding protein
MRLVSGPDRARWSGRAGRPGRRAASVAAAAAGLMLVAGCHFPGFSSSAGAGPTASGTVTVVAPPGVADAPLYIGVRDGMFSRAGLTVHVVSADSVRQELAALRSHHADFAFGDYANMFYAQDKSLAPRLLAVADGYDAGPNTVEVLTLPGSGIVQPKDLEFRTVGTAQQQLMPTRSQTDRPLPYSIDTVAAWSVLSSDNVQPGNINWVPMATAGLVDALKNHQVAAILATEPTIYQAESELGAVPVLDACTGATANLPLAGYFTTSSYATKNAQVVAAFRGALERAQADAGMAAPLQTALTKGAGLKAETAAMVTLGIYPTTLSAANLQRVVKLLFDFSALPHQFSVPAIVAKPDGS